MTRESILILIALALFLLGVVLILYSGHQFVSKRKWKPTAGLSVLLSGVGGTLFAISTGGMFWLIGGFLAAIVAGLVNWLLLSYLRDCMDEEHGISGG